MRADMSKVLVERPRVRHGDPSRGKGYKKRAAKALADGGGPVREGMKRRTPRSKQFNEHLGPLRRFLDANVGRPWDKVYAEICAHVDRGNVVQNHILTHLFDYVVTHVEEVDGEPVDARPRWRFAFLRSDGGSLRTSTRPQWYVCPRSGLLRRSRRVARQKLWPETPRPRHVTLSPTEVCVESPTGWELLTVEPKPRPVRRDEWDDLYSRIRTWERERAEAIRLDGYHGQVVSRRPLSKAEQRQLPIPIDWIR